MNLYHVLHNDHVVNALCGQSTDLEILLSLYRPGKQSTLRSLILLLLLLPNICCLTVEVGFRLTCMFSSRSGLFTFAISITFLYIFPSTYLVSVLNILESY